MLKKLRNWRFAIKWSWRNRNWIYNTRQKRKAMKRDYIKYCKGIYK